MVVVNWLYQDGELAKRSLIYTAYGWVSQAWVWSELVVLLLNKKRGALQDFIAGTIIIKVRPSPREETRRCSRQSVVRHVFRALRS